VLLEDLEDAGVGDAARKAAAERQPDSGRALGVAARRRRVKR
jgi:hypothetical protein